jgi:hypothetical protein
MYHSKHNKTELAELSLEVYVSDCHWKLLDKERCGVIKVSTVNEAIEFLSVNQTLSLDRLHSSHH